MFVLLPEAAERRVPAGCHALPGVDLPGSPARILLPLPAGPLECTRRQAAIAASKWGWGWRAAPRPVAGCWAVPADPSELTAWKARDCGFLYGPRLPVDLVSLPRKLPTPGLLMGVFTFPSEETEHPSRLETPRGLGGSGWGCGWVGADDLGLPFP